MVWRIVGSQTLTVQRRSIGTLVDGEYVDSLEDTFEIQGSIQPLGFRETENLPSGQRTKQNRTLFSRTELRVSDLDNPSLGDIVLFQNSVWRVWGLNNFDLGTVSKRIQHYQYRLVRIGSDMQ